MSEITLYFGYGRDGVPLVQIESEASPVQHLLVPTDPWAHFLGWWSLIASALRFVENKAEIALRWKAYQSSRTFASAPPLSDDECARIDAEVDASDDAGLAEFSYCYESMT